MADGIRVKDLPQYQGDVNTPNVSIPIDGAALTQGNQITGEQLLKPAMDEIAQLGRKSEVIFSPILLTTDVDVAKWGLTRQNSMSVYNGGYFILDENGEVLIGNSNDGLWYIYVNIDTKKIYACNFRNYSFNINNIFIAFFYFSASNGNINYCYAREHPFQINGKKYGLWGTELRKGDEFNPLINNNVTLILPDKLFLIESEKYSFYKDSILRVTDDRVKIGLLSNGMQLSLEQIDFYASDLSDNIKIFAKVDNYGSTQYGVNLQIVRKTVASEPQKRYCGIGDSLTNRGLIDAVKSYSDNKNLNILPVGTRNCYLSKGEGRSGWASYHLIGRNNYVENTYVKPYKSGDDVTSNYVNPFLKLATADDKLNYPIRCYRSTNTIISPSTDELSYSTDTDKTGDFYIFDWANYVNVQLSGNYPTHVTIGMGWNDITQRGITDATNSLIVDSVRFIIERILKANTDTKIAVIPAHAFYIRQTQRFNNMYSLVNQYRSMLSDVNTQYSSGIEMIGVWAMQNRDYIYPYNELSDLLLTDGNSTRKYTVTDNVHFGQIGKNEYAKLLAGWIINI